MQRTSTLREILRENSIGFVLGAATAVLYFVASFRYGYFRDELYFIACAHHLAWGYVDQPPLVAIAAWLSAPFDYALPALRILPILAAGGTVFVSCALARQFGGNRLAEIFAGIGTCMLPENAFLGSTLTTSSFEPLTWTLTISLFATCALHDDAKRTARIWYAIAAVGILAFYAKYSILLLLAALVLGVLVTPQRSILKHRTVVIAVVIAALAILPNVAWQALHGWPIVEVLHNDVAGRHPYNSGLVFQTQNLTRNAALFTLEQLLFTNPVLVPIWLTGLVTLLVHRSFARFRFIAITYLLVLLAAIALEAKSYYIAGVYPALYAAGVAWIWRWIPRGSTTPSWSSLAKGATVVLTAASAFFIPLALAILPARTLAAYEVRLGIKEARGNPPRLVHPLFAEEFGWPELAQRVARVYDTLPPGEREHTAIFADNYGDAGALDFYGSAYHLPPVLSGQNAYFLWSVARLKAMPVPPTTFIAVGATQAATLRATFGEVQLVQTYLHPYRWSAEGPTPIYLCRFPAGPIARLFSRFRWYGA